jgi:molybdopterin/thiamine biosynthesis adenylyltransferase
MIVYLSQEELDVFVNGELESLLGYAYEWEDEGVVHLHTQPLAHAFGHVSKCLFSKHSNLNSVPFDDVLWHVFIADEGCVKVSFRDENKFQSVVFQIIPSKENLYSRNKGILEIGVLEHKHIVIIGLGSFGSQIAIELAKAGVGEFSLFDFDRVELHNLARHTCFVKDLGRLKTDAIEESIFGKNPYAIVHKHPIDIVKNRMELEEAVQAADLVICATDNNPSRFVLSEVVYKYRKTCVFGRAFTRAEGGDVFISRPGNACYSCMVGGMGDIAEEITNAVSARRNGIIPAYVSEQDANVMVQVGLSTDIEPICNMMVKLALVELSKGEESGISSLENELVYNYYIWANRRERKFANWHVLPGAGNLPTIMRWYGAHISKRNDCAICSDEIILDVGEDIEEMFNTLNILKQ